MPGIARAGAQPESDTEEAERDILQLEAEPDDAYGNFHNDLPAYLLAKVDGDELAHLLESGHATPFDTPRAEDEAPEEEPEEEAVEEEEEQPTHTIKKPETTIDKTVLVPGEADNETEMNRQAMGGVVEMQRQDESIRQAAHRSRVDAIDAALEGEWQHDDERHGVWSVSHARLLYLISIFANESPYPDDDEPWIKELHLMVFIYELIEAALLPFCKVPQWMMAVDDQGKSQKIWLLIAQEAVGFINDLCKRGFVHVLRVSTEDGWSENAYRCTAQGIEFLRSAPEKLKSQVDHVVTDRRDGETFEVVIQDMGLYMKNRSGYRRKSSVTEIGKLPYVTSPYFASSIRHIDCVLKDNSALAYECVLWPSQVPDDRDEAVVLANVSIILAEWMMTGSNSIGLMIEALEGSVFSERDAHSVTFTTSQAGGGLMMTLSKKTSCSDELKTRSTIIDFQPSIDLNFEAEIIVQGEAAVKRVENFGVHVHENGVIMCAVQVEALQDREWDDLAPSLLANMIKELHYNSSLIIHPMMSKLQNDVLSSLYDGSPMSRTKTLCILADTIEPQLKAIEYMDGGRYQKEFVQLLGEVHTCRDLTDDDIIFIGKEGVLLAGPKSRELEYLIVKYVSLMVIDQGIIGIYARLRRLSNALEACHRMILKRRQQVVDRVNPRDVINKAGQHLRLMWMMQESIDQSIKKFAPVNRPSDHTHQRLWEMLDFIAYKNDIILRCNDLDRTLRRTQNEVRTLTDIQDIEDRIDLEEVFEMAHKDTEKLSVPPNATLNHFGEVHMRSEVPLRIITCCFGGFLTRDILHRLHIGIETGGPTPSWFSNSFAAFNDAPLLLFILCLAVFMGGCYLTIWYATRIANAAKSLLWRSVKLNLPIKDLTKFVKFLHNSGCNLAAYDEKKLVTHEAKIIQATFQDSTLLHWLGEYPMLTITYDSENSFLLTAKFAWPYWGRHISQSDIRDYVVDMFVKAGALAPQDSDSKRGTQKDGTGAGKRKSAVEKRKAMALKEKAAKEEEKGKEKKNQTKTKQKGK